MSDLFAPKERGNAMALYSLGPLLGIFKKLLTFNGCTFVHSTGFGSHRRFVVVALGVENPIECASRGFHYRNNWISVCRQIFITPSYLRP